MRRTITWVLQSLLFAGSACLAPADGAGLWPVEFEYGACVRNRNKPDVLVWTPPDAKRLRALLIIIANTDSKHFGEYAATRQVAVEREMGIVYLRCSEVLDDLARRKPGGDATIVQGILNAAAAKTGIAEFRYAPWIPFGKSSMGRFPFYMCWAYPERTIAAISYHAETPTWPVADWARLDGETIPYVNVNGETEWGGTWNRHVRPSLLNYREQKGWLAHQVVVHDVGHGDYPDVHGGPGWGKPFPGRITCTDVWDYLALFLDKVIAARVPGGVYPTDGPVKLNRLDEAGGFLVDPYAVERLFKIPRLPLERSPNGYLVDPSGEEPTAGFISILPAKDYTAPDGVPVGPLTVGSSPSRWLITEGTDFAMKADPMASLGAFQTLRPKSGDTVKIDGVDATFQPIAPKHVRRGGGINLRAGLQKQAKCTFLAFTVLDVPGTARLKVNAPFTQSGRVQVVLNSTSVAHRQVIELAKGLYPMLVVVRLKTKWASLKTSFEAATDEEVAAARKATVEAKRRAADAHRLTRKAEAEPTPLVEPAVKVDAAERKKRFWVIDQALAYAWLRLHDVHGIARTPRDR